MTTKTKKIVFTGGGSAGHVMPNLALIKKFQQNGWEISYIGSYNGIEKELITKLAMPITPQKADIRHCEERMKTSDEAIQDVSVFAGFLDCCVAKNAPRNDSSALGNGYIPYYTISTGKLRRYFSWQNFIDPFKIIFGVIQACILLHKLKPNAVFSKGGFVAFPVVVGAWVNRIPTVIHEADLTLGLTNKLCAFFATKICVTFPETINQIKNKRKAIVTGIPIRESFFNGDAVTGKALCGFAADKKVILVFGGSLGADQLNKIVRQLLPGILEHFQIVHVCGEGKVDTSCNYNGYKQFAYLDEEFPHALAAADLVISRSGANSIYELIALRKPNILIPLDKTASRGDQILNAQYCQQRGFSEVILQEQLTPEFLLNKIASVEQNSARMIVAMEGFGVLESTKLIYDVIQETTA